MNLPARLDNGSGMILDIALAMEAPDGDLDKTLKAYSLTEEMLVRLRLDPAFEKQLESWRTEVRDNGLSFKLKSRAYAEEMLPEVRKIAGDEDLSPNSRLDAIRTLAKWGGLEKVEKEGGVTPAFTMTVDLGSDQKIIVTGGGG